MAELEVDQSHLPRVEEVCQCFAVLEDGVLAHNLQEQEIEHYYTTNMQKNQLVQNDIRMAKRLQDEEEEQRTQQRALLRQASRQLEEQDSEYARIIQEEIQRCAEEARRREQEDEEMAKQIQGEEEQRVRRRSSREQESLSDDSTSGPALPSPHQHTLSSLHQGEGQHHPSTATRWQCSTSHTHSDFTGPQAVSPRGVAAQKNTTPWSNEGHTDSIRQIRNELREPLSEDSEDSDTVFSEQLSVWSQRMDQRLNTAPCRRRASLHQPRERSYKSLHSHSSFREERGVLEEDRGEWDEDYEYGDLEERRARNRERERNLREDYEGLHRNGAHDRNSRTADVRERRCSRRESVRLQDRDRHNNRDLARTLTYRDNPDKRVHFQDDTRRCNSYNGDHGSVWEMLGQVLRERGVAVRHGVHGAPLQVRPQSRDSQVLHGSEVSYGDSQPHQRVFQRAATTRRSYHGDVRERRRSSYRENGERDYRGDRERHHDSQAIAENDGVEVYEEHSRDSGLANRERGGSTRWRRRRGARPTKDDEREEDARYDGDCRVRRSTSERWHWHKNTEEKLSSEEEQEVERRIERHRRRAPQRSQSLSSSGASTRHRSRHATAGAETEGACLHMGELQQVLEDEELARRLQEEEDKLLRRSPKPSPRSSYSEGDFRVAQVAQDEEIARFMQKQEMKSKRDLEGPSSWHEHREMINQHDRRAARERQHPSMVCPMPQVQRERLGSEGLPSPTEDYSPENQPPSPISTIPQAQHIRNIAEELDPTFKARRQGNESLRVGQTGPACQSLPISNSGLHDFVEEPTFIPPTKRQSDKPGRTKPKEKKENCKQQ